MLRIKTLMQIFALAAIFVLSGYNLAVSETIPGSIFEYTFSSSGKLVESSSASISSSPYWWLKNGGYMLLEGGFGKTIQGDLPISDSMRKSYALKDGSRSDNGFHPQNNFNLLTKSDWLNQGSEIVFQLSKLNIYSPTNNQIGNGFYLASRYLSDESYYFGGFRVDGSAYLGKSVRGNIRDLGSVKYFPGTYDKTENPNLIPLNKDIVLKLKTENSSDGNVSLKLMTVDPVTNQEKIILTTTDSLDKTGTNPIMSAGKSGIISKGLDTKFDNFKISETKASTGDTGSTSTTPTQTTTAYYGLSQSAEVQEVGSMAESSNSNWWVNSGAYFRISNGIGKTIIGNLPTSDKWYSIYASANSIDTDGGSHPQNIFRLLTKTTWQNMTQEGYFKMDKYNVSQSPNRDGHNGILFFNRYKDSQNLYYTGIRVDGNAIIKKKVGGTYYTMASRKIISGSYNRSSNPNLIPLNQWIGLRSVVKNNPDGTVSIKLYTDLNNSGVWTLAAEASDNGSSYGTPIKDKAYAGIRTDFADVEVTKYSIKEM